MELRISLLAYHNSMLSELELDQLNSFYISQI